MESASPTRDAVATWCEDAWREGVLPRASVADWRIHPATLALVARQFCPASPPQALDVGAGHAAPLANALTAHISSVVALDVRPAVNTADRIPRVRALVQSLPFADGVFPLVVSRMLFGAPVSQRARRALAASHRAADPQVHADTARRLEADMWAELWRVTAPGGVQVHHVLERRVWADPAACGFDVLWSVEPESPQPPGQPWSAHPRLALRAHLGAVLVLRRPPVA